MDRIEHNCRTGETRTVVMTQAEIDALPKVTFEQQASAIDRAIEAHAEAIAKAKGYLSADRFVSYAGYPNPYQAEALAFAQWRTSCFTYAIAEMQKVKAGTRTMPTVEEAIAELPKFTWP